MPNYHCLLSYALFFFTFSNVVLQGLVFLRKDLCNVREIEFAKAVRVTHSTMEQVSFTVPRVKVRDLGVDSNF